jgi:exonuclease SbcD
LIKFLHVADIHLDSPLQGLETYAEAPVDDIRGATRRAFVRLVDLAVAEEIDFLIIAGDLYDGAWKDYNTGLFFVAQMGRLQRAGIKVFLVAGNHDAESRITRNLSLPGNVHSFSSRKPESVYLDELGVILHGQSYARREVRENLALDYPLAAPGLINIGILHTSLAGREGHEAYAPCRIDDLVSRGYDYWALGHVHRREEVSSRPWIVFPGNIQGRHSKEGGAKGATMVTVDDDHRFTVSHQPLDVLRWSVCEIDLSGCAGETELQDRVRGALEKEQKGNDTELLCVRLVLRGETALHATLMERTRYWTEELRGICLTIGELWLEQVVFATSRPAQSLDFEEETPIGALLRAVRQLAVEDAAVLTEIAELASLKSKLPVELLDRDETLLSADQARLSQLSEEIRELLIAGLLRHGDRT